MRARDVGAVGERLVDRLIALGIGGGGGFKGAVVVADKHLLAAGGDREEAVRRLVATHVRLAAGSGFVTGLGGIATLPVTVPAAMAGLYVIATRMSAGIAHLRGYDVGTEEVHSAVLISLLGSAGAATLKRAGIEIGKKSTTAALQKVPGRLFIEPNKKVGYRLITKAGEKASSTCRSSYRSSAVRSEPQSMESAAGRSRPTPCRPLPFPRQRSSQFLPTPGQRTSR